MDSPVWPLARFDRYSSLDAFGVEWPEYVRISHGWSRSCMAPSFPVRGSNAQRGTRSRRPERARAPPARPRLDLWSGDLDLAESVAEDALVWLWRHRPDEQR